MQVCNTRVDRLSQPPVEKISGIAGAKVSTAIKDTFSVNLGPKQILPVLLKWYLTEQAFFLRKG